MEVCETCKGKHWVDNPAYKQWWENPDRRTQNLPMPEPILKCDACNGTGIKPEGE